jgi:hypothetical protein
VIKTVPDTDCMSVQFFAEKICTNVQLLIWWQRTGLYHENLINELTRMETNEFCLISENGTR